MHIKMTNQAVCRLTGCLFLFHAFCTLLLFFFFFFPLSQFAEELFHKLTAFFLQHTRFQFLPDD